MPSPPWFALPSPPSSLFNSQPSTEPIVVVGAGLAGCHIAYALAERNVPVILVDSGNTIAAGASANQAGICKPFVTRNPGLTDQFYDVAFHYLLDLLGRDAAKAKSASFHACGVLQLLHNTYPDNPAFRNCTTEQASKFAGIDINGAAIHFAKAGWLNPASLCISLVQHPNIVVRLNSTVLSIEQIDTKWVIETEISTAQKKSASNTITCRQLILANGERLNQFVQTNELPITAARGQTSRFSVIGENPLSCVITGKRYIIPDGNDLIVGASFNRDNNNREIQPEDHQQNRHALKELLPTIKISVNAAGGYCGIRATTPDRLPLLGPVPDFPRYRKDFALIKNGLPEHRFQAASYQTGLFVMGGFGSRGIVSAPYCAKLLADYLTNNVSHLIDDGSEAHVLAKWSALLHPGRFLVRALKRA